MKFLRQSLTGLFLLALTVGLLAVAAKTIFDAAQTAQSRDGFRPPARERVFAVNVVTAKAETIAPILTAFGEVSSTRTLEIRAESGGRLVYLSPVFQDGGSVTGGQLLATVDPLDAEAQLARVKADMLDAEAEVRDAKRALELATDELAASQEQSELRDRALERQIDLRERGVVTEAAVETSELTASSARAAVLGKRQSLANAEARVDQAQTRMARQNIALAEAERALAATQITAGFSGSLSGVNVVEGRLVSTNEKLGELIDPDSLEVSFRISTAQYARLLGPDGAIRKAPVDVKLDVGGVELVSKGRIDRDSAAVGEGQTGRLVYAFIDTAIGLKPGDFVAVSVQEPAVDNVTRLPASAYGSDGAILSVDEDGRLQSIDVELVRRQGDDVLIKSDGLDGKQIVAERTPLLGAGIGVRVLEQAEAEAIAASSERQQPVADRPQAGQGGGGSGRPGGGQGGGQGQGDGEMIALSDERRQKLIDAINANPGMPANAKERFLGMLQQPEVPKAMVERLESRMRN